MYAQLYVGNLPKRITQTNLSDLFTRVGDVFETILMTDRKSGAAKAYAFITMNTQSEADQAVSTFNRYLLDEHNLIIHLAKPRAQRGINDPACRL